MKFDLVVGNPPYQESKEHGKKVTGDGAPWVKFTVIMIRTLKESGYLMFLIPDSWQAPTYDLMGSRLSIFQDFFKKGNLLCSVSVDKNIFADVGVGISYFVFQNTKYSGATNIDGVLIDITDMPFIPKNKESLSICSKVLTKTLNSRQAKMRWNKAVTEIKWQETKTDEYCYPFIDHNSYKPIRWANKKDPDQYKRKVIFPYIGTYQAIVDDKGEYGTNPQSAILFLNKNENKEAAEGFYGSKLISFLVNSNKWTQYLLVGNILNYIPVPDLSREWTDLELYEWFELTQEEIDEIEKSR